MASGQATSGGCFRGCVEGNIEKAGPDSIEKPRKSRVPRHRTEGHQISLCAGSTPQHDPPRPSALAPRLTPKTVAFYSENASWINLVERWFALLTEKQLRRGIHRSTRDLEVALDRYLTVYNEVPKPFVWFKTADEILASVARFCHRISDSGH
jgi:hypothetical protein